MGKKSKKNINLTYNHPDLRNPFNTLVANIRFASIDNQVKTISVVSDGEDEGKTTVCANLALSLVNSGKRVVIVDCDMRRRSVAKCIQVFPRYGIYSLLSGACSVYEAVTKVGDERLFFLDCEPNIPNPAAVLSSNKFAKLLDFLHDNFDYVLLDTPALSTFVDGALLSALTDATIVVVRESVCKKSSLENTINQLKAAQANILGAIMTFSTEAYDNQYYYAYYNSEGKRVYKEHDEPNKSVSDTVAAQNIASWYKGSADGGAQKRQRAMNEQELKQPSNKKPSGVEAKHDDNATLHDANKAKYKKIKSKQVINKHTY